MTFLFYIEKKLTMIHLLPSSFFTGGFLVRMLSGLGFFPGAGLLARDIEETLDWLSLRVGTVAPARNDGFLWVIWSALTFRRPCVTASPLFNSEKTAPSPPLSEAGAAFGSSNLIGGGGGPGGGGGGGPPAACGGGRGAPGCDCSSCFIASSADTPFGFQGMP